MRKKGRLPGSSEIGSLIFFLGLFIVMWLINGINFSVNDYQLFSLFFDPLLGFWIFVLMIGVCILLLFVARNRYWRTGWKGNIVSFLYGGMSTIMILITIVVTFRFAMPSYIAHVRTQPSQAQGIIERLSYSSSRGATSYYMYANGTRYAISRPWYNELDVGKEVAFITIGQRAFPEGFVDFTVVGLMVTIAVLIGWFFTLYLIVIGLVAFFDKSDSYGLLEFLDGII